MLSSTDVNGLSNGLGWVAQW